MEKNLRLVWEAAGRSEIRWVTTRQVPPDRRGVFVNDN